MFRESLQYYQVKNGILLFYVVLDVRFGLSISLIGLYIPAQSHRTFFGQQEAILVSCNSMWSARYPKGL